MPERKHRKRIVLGPQECAAEDCDGMARERAGARGGIPKYCSPGCAKRQKDRNADRRKRYAVHGSALSDYDRLLLEQEGRCAICRTSSPGGRGDATRFPFDHDHETSRPRGLLCYLCNLGLGAFQDDPERLQSAIAYLEKHNAAAVTPRGEKVG